MNQNKLRKSWGLFLPTAFLSIFLPHYLKADPRFLESINEFIVNIIGIIIGLIAFIYIIVKFLESELLSTWGKMILACWLIYMALVIYYYPYNLVKSNSSSLNNNQDNTTQIFTVTPKSATQFEAEKEPINEKAKYLEYLLLPSIWVSATILMWLFVLKNYQKVGKIKLLRPTTPKNQ